MGVRSQQERVRKAHAKPKTRFKFKPFRSKLFSGDKYEELSEVDSASDHRAVYSTTKQYTRPCFWTFITPEDHSTAVLAATEEMRSSIRAKLEPRLSKEILQWPGKNHWRALMITSAPSSTEGAFGVISELIRSYSSLTDYQIKRSRWLWKARRVKIRLEVKSELFIVPFRSYDQKSEQMSRPAKSNATVPELPDHPGHLGRARTASYSPPRDFETIGPSHRSTFWTGHNTRDRGDTFCPDRSRPLPTGLAPARPLHVFHHAIRSSGDQIIGRHHSPRHGAANHDGEYCYPQEVMNVDVHPNNYPFRNHESFVPRREAKEEKLMEAMQQLIECQENHMKEIDSRFKEMKAEFDSKIDALTIDIKRVEEQVGDVKNELINHFEDIQDHNTKIINMGYSIDSMESHLMWRIEEIQEGLTNPTKFPEWRSDQSYHNGEKEAAAPEENPIPDSKSKEKDYPTDEEEAYLNEQINESRLEDYPRRNHEFTESSNEGDEGDEEEELKDVYSCMTIRIPNEEVPENANFGQLRNQGEASFQGNLRPQPLKFSHCASEDWESSPRSREGRFHSPYQRRAENNQERFTPNRLSFHQPNPSIQDHSRVPWRQKSHEERLESLMSQYLDQQALDTRTLHMKIDKINSVLLGKIGELSLNPREREDQVDLDDINRIQSRVNGIDESIWQLQTRIMNLETRDGKEDAALEDVIRRQGEVENNNIKCLEGQSHIQGALRRVSMDSSKKYIGLFDNIIELSNKVDNLSSRVDGHHPLESEDEESIPDTACSAANTYMEEPPDEFQSKRALERVSLGDIDFRSEISLITLRYAVALDEITWDSKSISNMPILKAFIERNTDVIGLVSEIHDTTLRGAILRAFRRFKVHLEKHERAEDCTYRTVRITDRPHDPQPVPPQATSPDTPSCDRCRPSIKDRSHEVPPTILSTYSTRPIRHRNRQADRPIRPSPRFRS
ncbi:hypothetical protein ISN44_As11g030200 [Arabidopsis suecica]|uniref:Uncharacterized protein n=1 Tax=Arabidopsis suecica TaxID=45249 RepID=A0A8T1ZD77_ARASU|nr:hypothetical protein ISN44_As11g030200 [Arabidopsis suecica]